MNIFEIDSWNGWKRFCNFKYIFLSWCIFLKLFKKGKHLIIIHGGMAPPHLLNNRNTRFGGLVDCGLGEYDIVSVRLLLRNYDSFGDFFPILILCPSWRQPWSDGSYLTLRTSYSKGAGPSCALLNSFGTETSRILRLIQHLIPSLT